MRTTTLRMTVGACDCPTCPRKDATSRHVLSPSTSSLVTFPSWLTIMSTAMPTR